MLMLRDALSLEEREISSLAIAKCVIEQDAFCYANRILLFSSYKSEVDTSKIYKTAKALGKDVYYPRVQEGAMDFYQVDEKTNWEINRYGIREPQIVEEKRFIPQKGDWIYVLMPGVVFDCEKNRIGYGGGYYDKYLQWLETQTNVENLFKVAVAFECQMIESGRIVHEAYDIKPDCIVTEKRCYL